MCSNPLRKESIDLLPIPNPTDIGTGNINITQPIPMYSDGIFPPPQDMPSISTVFPDLSSAKTGLLAGMELPDPSSLSLSLKRDHSDMTTSKEDANLYEDEETVKKKRRLAKNREIAKNCRRRKKEKKEAIIEEVHLIPPPSSLDQLSS